MENREKIGGFGKESEGNEKRIREILDSPRLPLKHEELNFLRKEREGVARILGINPDQLSLSEKGFHFGVHTHHIGDLEVLAEGFIEMKEKGIGKFPTVIKGGLDLRGLISARQLTEFNEELKEFPEDLEALYLDNLLEIKGLPEFPKKLKTLSLLKLATLEGLPPFPESLEELYLGIKTTKGLPPLPSYLKKFSVSRDMSDKHLNILKKQYPSLHITQD
ncbi:MAG: hypothetical protein OXU73_02990 [Candidatus Campbellbacteria bacterium]|nr:hypothetical protein [Candidatus Campbellbacteria bacterium]